MTAHAKRLFDGLSPEIFGATNWITATFPRNCDESNTKIQIPTTEEKFPKGSDPTIVEKILPGRPVESIFSTTMNVPKKIMRRL